MPPIVLGGISFDVCSAVSYFSTRVGSIIGAGRLSFRVRDGSGRFPAAMSAVTLFKCVLVVGCVHGWAVNRIGCWLVWLRVVGKFSAG